MLTVNISAAEELTFHKCHSFSRFNKSF